MQQETHLVRSWLVDEFAQILKSADDDFVGIGLGRQRMAARTEKLAPQSCRETKETLRLHGFCQPGRLSRVVAIAVGSPKRSCAIPGAMIFHTTIVAMIASHRQAQTLRSISCKQVIPGDGRPRTNLDT